MVREPERREPNGDHGILQPGAPEYTGAPEPPAIRQSPGEWQGEQPSSLPLEERADPRREPPPQRQPAPEVMGQV